MTANDAYERAAYNAERDQPTRAEAALDDAMTSRRPDPNKRSCCVGWVSHDYEGWKACGFCQGFLPRCSWRNDKCQHGAFIDDPTTSFDELTKHHYCSTPVTETRSA